MPAASSTKPLEAHRHASSPYVWNTQPESSVPICLSGVAIAGDYAAALITENGKPGMRRVRKGDIIDDWTVGEIGARYVVFTHAGESVRINLTKDDKLGATQDSAKTDDAGDTDTDSEDEDQPKAKAKPAPNPAIYDPRYGPGHHPKDN